MPKSPDDLVRAGRRYFRRANYQKAIASFQQALAHGDNDGRISEQLSGCYQNLGRTDEALEALQAAIEHSDPHSGDLAEWHLRLARILAAKEDVGAADAQYREAWRSCRSNDVAMELAIDKWRGGFAPVSPASEQEAELISRIANAIRVPGSRTDMEELEIVNALSTIASQPAFFWLYIYGSLLRIGHARAALEAKCVAARLIVGQASAEPPRDIDGLKTVIAAACYVADFEGAAHMISAYRDANADGIDWRVGRCEFDMLLCQGQVDDARVAVRKIEFDPAGLGYKALLEGRSSAVVGPAQNSLASGAKIDSRDLIVRTNFSGPQIIAANGAMLGRRTDIVYYNSPFIECTQVQVAEAVAGGDLKFIVTRTGAKTRWFAERFPAQPVRTWRSYKKPDFIGISFALRHILFDMMLFADRPIGVFGADFYLGESTHYAGYFDQGIDVLYQFTRHDPFDTFLFLRALYKARAIEPDEILADILSLTVSEFAGKLSEKFAV